MFPGSGMKAGGPPSDHAQLYPATPGRLLHLDAGGQKTFYYYLTDQVGSVMQVIREDGTVVNRYDYDAFGNAVAANTSEQVENRYRFQGREYDAHRGDYYFRNRTYIPEWGVFTGPDALVQIEANGPCNYLFANNNPLRYVDPEGLGSLDIELLIARPKPGCTGGMMVVSAHAYYKKDCPIPGNVKFNPKGVKGFFLEQSPTQVVTFEELAEMAKDEVADSPAGWYRAVQERAKMGLPGEAFIREGAQSEYSLLTQREELLGGPNPYKKARLRTRARKLYGQLQGMWADKLKNAPLAALGELGDLARAITTAKDVVDTGKGVLEATSEKARADKIATGYSALGITVTARQIEELDELAVDNDFSKWPGAVKDILEKSGQFRDVKIILVLLDFSL